MRRRSGRRTASLSGLTATEAGAAAFVRTPLASSNRTLASTEARALNVGLSARYASPSLLYLQRDHLILSGGGSSALNRAHRALRPVACMSSVVRPNQGSSKVTANASKLRSQ